MSNKKFLSFEFSLKFRNKSSNNLISSISWKNIWVLLLVKWTQSSTSVIIFIKKWKVINDDCVTPLTMLHYLLVGGQQSLGGILDALQRWCKKIWTRHDRGGGQIIWHVAKVGEKFQTWPIILGWLKFKFFWYFCGFWGIFDFLIWDETHGCIAKGGRKFQTGPRGGQKIWIVDIFGILR